MDNSRLEKLLAMYDDKNHDSFILFAIAKEYYYLGDVEKSLMTYIKLKSIDEKCVGLYYHLAKLYEEKLENENALITYNEGIQQAKKQADFHALSELLNAKQNLEIEM
jgi:tetratricopeptide (TPR) repeat protein